jgi:nitrogen-fixing nifU domain protein
MATPLLFYPQTTPNPLELEWVVGPGLIRFTWSGGLQEARQLAAQDAMPQSILGYLERGKLAHISLAPGLITTVLPEGGSWQSRSPVTDSNAAAEVNGAEKSAPLATRLRHDLFAAISTPITADNAGASEASAGTSTGKCGWPTGSLDVPSIGGSTDAELRAAVEELLGGAAGRFAASHGGTMRLVSVQDGVVKISMGGACRNCPAIGRTLLFHVDRQLRPFFPNLVRVEEAK